MVSHLDPVVLKEKLARLTKDEAVATLRRKALRALIWFDSNVFRTSSIDHKKVLETCVLSLSSEFWEPTGTEDPTQYVQQALDEMKSTILLRAIELAQRDLQATESGDS